jgi:pimeloyl-ACP methyl ester carboxylesterase
VLIIHGRDDHEVTFRNAEDIAAARPSARLMAFDGLGHRNVLFAPPVFRAVMHELAPKRDGAQPRRPATAHNRAHDLRHSA